MTTPTATDQTATPAPKPTKAATKPAARVGVPVKPVATSAANATTLIASAIAANPLLGAAIAAGVVGTAGAVAGGRAIRRSRTFRTRLALPSARATRRLRRAIGGSALGRGVSAGSGRSPVGRTLRDLATAPARTARRSTTDGRRGSGLRAPGGGAPTSRTATARNRRPSPIARATRTVGRLGAATAGVGAGLAWRATRATGRAGGRMVRRGWRGAGRFVRRRLLHQKPPAAKPTPTPTPTRRPVGPTVNRPNTGAPQPTGTPRTPAVPSTTRGPDMPQPQPLPAPAPVGPVYQAARRLHGTAVDHQVKGMLEVRTEAHELPHTIAEVAAAIRARAAACAKEPLDQAYAAHLAQIAVVVDTAAQAARSLGPSFDALHDTEVRRLLQPRPNEQKWDTSANGRGA